MLKKDSRLQLYVNYYSLNQVTIKNQLALLLILKILDYILGVTIFLKINFKDIYYYIPIIITNYQKIIFYIHYRYFKYNIILFRLIMLRGEDLPARVVITGVTDTRIAVAGSMLNARVSRCSLFCISRSYKLSTREGRAQGSPVLLLSRIRKGGGWEASPIWQYHLLAPSARIARPKRASRTENNVPVTIAC